MARNKPEEARTAASLERECNQLQDAIDSALEHLREGRISKGIATLAEFESEAEPEDDD